MININNLHAYSIKLYPEDNHKWGKREIELSGLIIAANCRVALEKVYEHCGVEFGKTICYPNIRSIMYEECFFNKDDTLTIGFSVLRDFEE